MIYLFDFIFFDSFEAIPTQFHSPFNKMAAEMDGYSGADVAAHCAAEALNPAEDGSPSRI